jgi:hypothetical protein
MPYLLKNHPFAVEAFFESSVVLTFSFPKEELEHLIPECLQLDTFDGRWAFVAVAIVKTKELRPKGFPQFLGNNFTLIGYRIFVRYTNNAGKRLRGLYILKSETDKKKMEYLGNIFTQYNYTTTDISVTQSINHLNIGSSTSNFNITLETDGDKIDLPCNSPFANWKEARKFAGPLPFTFTYNTETNEVLIIEGVRENWIPTPVEVINYNIPFLKSLTPSGEVLANAFIIKNIPYYWKKGKVEQWNH